MEIDHVVPEHLEDDPKKLKVVLAKLGLPSDFSLNTFENWLPACGPCNRYKREVIFDPAPIVKIQLQKAAKKAGIARSLETEAVSKAKLSRAINTVCRALSGETIPRQVLEPLVDAIVKHSPELLEGQWEYSSSAPGTMGLILRTHKPARLPLTPFHTIIMEDEWRIIVTTPFGTGAVPKGSMLDPSWYCGNCGSLGPWHGARCLSCGHLIED